MPTLRWRLACALVCLATFSLAQSRDQLAAERVLGPRWKQISRAAGMIFTGTVLEIRTSRVTQGGALPITESTFRVSRAIAGVQAGQVLTIRAWVGASLLQRPMGSGQRMLLLFYPPSPLGLTSPVGGSLGQLALDPSGRFVIAATPREINRSPTAPRPGRSPIVQSQISLDQLERAIRSARQERD